MVSLKSAFWKLAHERYQTRKPRRAWETIAYMWVSLALVTYIVPLVQDFDGNRRFILPGILVVGVPLVLALMHRRIRLERAKGQDALYRKRLDTSR